MFLVEIDVYKQHTSSQQKILLSTCYKSAEATVLRQHEQTEEKLLPIYLKDCNLNSLYTCSCFAVPDAYIYLYCFSVFNLY